MAEWLGRALQKLPQRFESARDLIKIEPQKCGSYFLPDFTLCECFTELQSLVAKISSIFIENYIDAGTRFCGVNKRIVVGQIKSMSSLLHQKN